MGRFHGVYQDKPNKGEHYPPDRGCVLAPKCLECPFPDCIEGTDQHRAHISATRRIEARDFYDSGLSVAAVAERCGVSTRTAARWLKQARD